MTKNIQAGDATAHAPTNAGDMVRFLYLKAQEFIAALELETGLKVEDSEQRNLQAALLEDFIEVHNAAIRHPLQLPESKAEVDRLIGR